MRFRLLQRHIWVSRLTNLALVVGFAVVILRSGVGFPFPPHSDAEWGVVLAYLIPVLAIVDQVRVELERARSAQA